MFKPENYSPENSVENIMLNAGFHGNLIAVVHQTSEDEETTSIFFSDQFVHTCNGFHLRDKNGKAGLQAIVGSIFGGWSYPDAVEALYEHPRKTKKTVHYCFGPVGFFEELAKEHNLGYHVYLKFLETIYTEGLGETIIMKEALQ